MSANTVSVDVTIDLTCIWSYLSFTNLERAVADYRTQGGTVTMVFHPFQVQPDAPIAGEPKTTELAREMGGDQGAGQALARVSALAAESGIDLHYDRTIATNTFAAHTLVGTAAAGDIAQSAVHRLFRAHFVEGLDLGDHTVLSHIATEVGATAHEDAAQRTEQALAQVRASGVDGVPRFVIGGGAELTGLQPRPVLLKAIRNATNDVSD